MGAAVESPDGTASGEPIADAIALYSHYHYGRAHDARGQPWTACQLCEMIPGRCHVSHLSLPPHIRARETADATVTRRAIIVSRAAMMVKRGHRHGRAKMSAPKLMSLIGASTPFESGR